MLGRWQRLGSQGFNVTVAAVFAYGVFAMPDAGKPPLILIWDLAGMVLLGAVIAVVTNLLIAPPLRYRSAADAVDGYCDSTSQLLEDMVAGLREAMPDGNAARDCNDAQTSCPERQCRPGALSTTHGRPPNSIRGGCWYGSTAPLTVIG